MLRDLPRAARVLVLTGPLFAPAALAAPFAVAYQRALGLDPALIGLAAAAATTLGFGFLAAGTWAAGRWGRLRAMSAFDLLGFVVPWVLLALARTPGEAVLAVLLGGSAQGAQAAFQGLLMAEARGDQRARINAWEHLLLALPTAAMPLLAAPLVAAWGLAPAVRALFLVAAASVAAMVAVRWVLLRGREPAPRAALAPALVPTLRGLGGAGLGPPLLATFLLALAGGLGILAAVRITEVLRLPAWWLGPYAFAIAGADLAASALSARLRANSRAWSLAAALASLAGSALFLAAASPAMVLASGAALGAAMAWSGIGLGALVHDLVPEALRDRAAGAQAAARHGGVLAGQALGGALFAAQDALPWVAAAAFAGLAALASARAGRRGESVMV